MAYLDLALGLLIGAVMASLYWRALLWRRLAERSKQDLAALISAGPDTGTLETFPSERSGGEGL